jgi:hypothetical protein
MKNMFNKLLDKNSSSLLIILLGFITQIVTYPILFIFGVTNHLNGRVMEFFGILSVIWFLVPLVSVGGIIIAIIQIRERKVSKLPIIGFILNIIWYCLLIPQLYKVVNIFQHNRNSFTNNLRRNAR